MNLLELTRVSENDEDYEIGRIQTLISEFKDRHLKKLEIQSNKKTQNTRK